MQLGTEQHEKASLGLTCLEVDALNYASFDSGDINFKSVQWAYNNRKLFFNMTCKT